MNFVRHTPRKRFGQHWLNDEGVLNQIVTAASLKSEDCVLEIGPGRGALTEKLINSKAGFIQAIELDRDLISGLHKRFVNEKKFSLREGDVLSTPLEPTNGLVINKVVANIPYNITGPLLKRLIGELGKPPDNYLECLVLLIQKEVAERILAMPGDSNFSALSVRIQLLADCKNICDVPASCFKPIPRVDSKVILIKPFSALNQDILDNGNLLDKLLKLAFSGRRKKLRNTIGRYITTNEQIKELASNKGITLEERPQQVSPCNWLAIAKTFKSHSIIIHG